MPNALQMREWAMGDTTIEHSGLSGGFSRVMAVQKHHAVSLFLSADRETAGWREVWAT